MNLHPDCDYAGKPVKCDRCGDEYVCTPSSDFYCTPGGDHCCEPCLMRGADITEMTEWLEKFLKKTRTGSAL